MQLLNPDHINQLIPLLNNSPYFRHLGIVIKELGRGYSIIELSINDNHYNPFGGLHGGVYSSLIDTAAYWAVYSDIPEDSGMVTMDLTVNNLSPVRNGILSVRGYSIKNGRTVSLAEASVFDENNKIIAQGFSKMMITPGLQTIKEVLEISRVKPIPYKFRN